MALVTLQRSPTPSAASSASTSEEFGNDDDRKTNLSLSDSFFMVKGAALFLQQGNSYQGQRSLQHLHKNAGDLPQHLQVVINLLRSEDRIKLAVRLESSWSDRVRYMVVVYSSGRQDTEENILLGVDFASKESKSCTIGMVLHLWSDTTIHMDGDGGFSVNTAGRTHVFKPVSVQAMWSALQVLHKACEVARRYNYFLGGLALVWASYYESCICSDQSCINEWNTMQDLESTRPDSPILFMEKPNEGERTEWVIKATLRSIMMGKDLENVTCKEIRNELEKKLSCNLKEYKEYIDNEMLLILGQMDKASLIFDYLYLGSEWNASNLEELHNAGVGYILNVTREIDNFFPGLFAYHNIRVYDEESTDLLSHWNDAYNFINKAKKNNSKCLVHCKMGVSRSASTVIAYAMKEYGWSMENAYSYVKQRRSVTRPNSGFMRQLLEYEGILDASKQRHNKLWRQQVDQDIPQTDLEDIFPTTFQANNMETDLEYRINDDDDAHPVMSEKRCCGTLTSTHELFEPPNVMLEVEELEKDALLEDAPFPEPYCTVEAKEKSDFDFRTLEVRKKLYFEGTLTPPNFGDDLKSTEYGSKNQVAALECNGEELRASKDFYNCSSKRSCPKDSEEDAIFGILSKVKPRYPSCTDCMYPSTAMTSDAYEEPQQLDSAETPTVCSQPALLQHMTSVVLNRMHGDTFSKGAQIPMDSQDYNASPSKTDQNFNDSVELNDVFGQVGSYENLASKRDSKPAKDLKYLFFSKELEKPAMHSYLMQHQESIIQLQKAGLVRKHTKELERLRSESSSVIKECPLDKTDSSSYIDGEGQAESGKTNKEPKDFEKLEVADVLEMGFIKTSTPSSCKMDLMSSYTKDFLKTICYTPTSSSISSNLTRSSSSDSIHSVRGKPGLVKQRTQEIETRMRLAGLTLSSPLKRSHSLAKLGSLNFSCDDLSCDADHFPKIDYKSTSFRDHSVCTETPSSSGTTETTSGHMESTSSSITETDQR
ncbi:PREDICTED: protein phosphatase Slingshot homolog 1 [Nanorana parkeri]|uniref:protein phosphatase Slingshot homolog 1 n=1 Tax=Nanorana parkeri TaxID=125878 RepID=UPI0008544E57|nr:PREDICTED: protein phosphatase Slingshot homolog 1 [Nanorana parkeri]